jgi:hypothetical protein
VDNPLNFGPGDLLMKPMEWLSYINTAPTPKSDASISMQNGLAKSSRAKTVASIRANFRVLKVVS